MLKQFREDEENPESGSFQILNSSNKGKKMKDYTEKYTKKIQHYQECRKILRECEEAVKEEARAEKKRRRLEARLTKMEHIVEFKHKRTHRHYADNEIQEIWERMTSDCILTPREYKYFYTRGYKKDEAKKLSLEEALNIKNKKTSNRRTKSND